MSQPKITSPQPKTTPGPWRAFADVSTRAFVVDNYCPREGNYDGLLVCSLGSGVYSEGNALLVASAPDMHAALEAAEEYGIHLEDCPYPYGRGCSECSRLSERVGRLRAVALAKARGKAKDA